MGDPALLVWVRSVVAALIETDERTSQQWPHLVEIAGSGLRSRAEMREIGLDEPAVAAVRAGASSKAHTRFVQLRRAQTISQLVR